MLPLAANSVANLSKPVSFFKHDRIPDWKTNLSSAAKKPNGLESVNKIISLPCVIVQRFPIVTSNTQYSPKDGENEIREPFLFGITIQDSLVEIEKQTTILTEIILIDDYGCDEFKLSAIGIVDLAFNIEPISCTTISPMHRFCAVSDTKSFENLRAKVDVVHKDCLSYLGNVRLDEFLSLGYYIEDQISREELQWHRWTTMIVKTSDLFSGSNLAVQRFLTNANKTFQYEATSWVPTENTECIPVNKETAAEIDRFLYQVSCDQQVVESLEEKTDIDSILKEEKLKEVGVGRTKSCLSMIRNVCSISSMLHKIDPKLYSNVLCDEDALDDEEDQNSNRILLSPNVRNRYLSNISPAPFMPKILEFFLDFERIPLFNEPLTAIPPNFPASPVTGLEDGEGRESLSFFLESALEPAVITSGMQSAEVTTKTMASQQKGSEETSTLKENRLPRTLDNSIDNKQSSFDRESLENTSALVASASRAARAPFGHNTNYSSQLSVSTHLYNDTSVKPVLFHQFEGSIEDYLQSRGQHNHGGKSVVKGSDEMPATPTEYHEREYVLALSQSAELKEYHILISESFYETYSELVAHLCSSCPVTMIDYPFRDCSDIVVSETTAIKMVKLEMLDSVEFKRSLLKDLTALSQRFSFLWILSIVRFVSDNYSEVLSKFLDFQHLFVRYPCRVMVRTCDSANLVSNLSHAVVEVCRHDASFGIQDQRHLSFYRDRDFLKYLRDRMDISALCDFLQLFPTINVFSALLLVCSFTSFATLAESTPEQMSSHLATILPTPRVAIIEERLISFWILLHKSLL